ncbi:tectonic-1-like isoform X2 [Odontomachus brunneus]|uniref:tectonic-1-like isoform X2 n=1 Tax=Odontomachus brunneus TaxID=486640 RepID=UPI0013F26B07|nr:tectonic-1-like isoform X2 [Odontomachus brunneus]
MDHPLKNGTRIHVEKKKYSCDINCCCDIDCNNFQLSAFSYCQDHHANLYNSQYCYNWNFIQRNNTSFILEKLTNNLFCILYDNLPSAYNIDNDLVLQNEKDLWEVIQVIKYKWNFKNHKTIPKSNLSKRYQHGDILWKLNNEYIEPIELLQSGFNGICSFKKTLKYLENWKSTCIQNRLTNANQYLFPIAFNNFTIISSLPLFNETLITGQVCRSNVCLPVRTHYCLNSFSACNKTKIPGFCMNSTCINIVKGLKYIIDHNGSAGINSIDAYFNMGNVSHTFYQYFEVQYRWINTDKTKIFARSGNPGYLIGKPIIVGLSRTNESDEILFNKSDAFLTLPLTGKNGECDKYIVAFGEDIKLKCSVKFFSKNFTSTSCSKLQNITMYLLMKDSLLNMSQRYGLYVSKLGNFTSTDLMDWLRIMFDRIPQNVVTARTIGKQITCSGLITSLHLDILYSALPKSKTLMNYKILGIGVTFGEEQDITWSKCTVKDCTNILHVDILSYVNFHDVSKPSKYYFVGGPNLDITLPYDFFYPFLNGSKKVEVSIILIVIVNISIYKYI